MKVFKLFLIFSVIAAIGYFSWSYYSGRFNHEKYKKATLVFFEQRNIINDSGLERFPCI